jgi:DNA-binding ferritin-like protein
VSEILGLTLAGATAAARALLLVIQTCHWQTSGDSFYGDHKLFELIYDETIEDIDRLGEKAVAMSDELSVDVISQFEGMGSFLQKMTNLGLGIPTP